MPKLAANLSMMFTELPFLERFTAAAEAGFKGVEFTFPYEFAAELIVEQLDKNKLSQVLFNCPPGDLPAGERGLAALPGREQQFRDSLEQALEYAEALNCPRLHLMAGVINSAADRDAAHKTYVDNLRYAAERFAKAGRLALLEPINYYDVPGFFLNYSYQAVEILDQIGADSLGLQFDLYHCQIMEGNLAVHLRELQPYVRHMQIAGVPGRHEPDVGEINYPYLFKLIDELNYDVWVGCEYHPAAETTAGLGWLAKSTQAARNDG